MGKGLRKTPIGAEISKLVANISKSKVGMGSCKPPVAQEAYILNENFKEFIDNTRLYTGAISGRPCHHFTKVAKSICNSGNDPNAKEVIPVNIGIIGCGAAKTLAKAFCGAYQYSLPAKEIFALKTAGGAKEAGSNELEALEKLYTGGLNCYSIEKKDGRNILIDKCKN